jgi:hypothetical protein
MTLWDTYLSRQNRYSVFPEENPPENLSYIVVIPSYNEPRILETLHSLGSCHPPKGAVEVIVSVNHPEGSSSQVREQSRKTMDECLGWRQEHAIQFLNLVLIDACELPQRDAGAGLARKAGMDEAIRRFRKIGNKNGVIISLDADTRVSLNYFTELDKLLSEKERFDGCNYFFEHPSEEADQDDLIVDGIIQYELFLRYFIQFLREISFPFAFHTIGSAFAVSAEAYVRQGGMNKRKAGEDFYFLHKLIPHGAFYELNAATVYPSPRVSDRVPFGTGAAQTRFYTSGDRKVLAYHPESFNELRDVFSQIEEFYLLKPGETPYSLIKAQCLREFMKEQEFEGKLIEIKKNSAGLPSFRKRFYNWFNAFRVFKFLNFAHLSFYDKLPVCLASSILLNRMNVPSEREASGRNLLEIYRQLQKAVPWRVNI